MLVRVVRMTFRTDALEEFDEIFRKASPQIRRTTGCLSLELLRDARSPDVLITLSTWEDENMLDQYRKSDLFVETWSRTKKLFAAPPRAESYVPITSSETSV